MNDELPNHVSGAYSGGHPRVCPVCRETLGLTILNRGPETENRRCGNCGNTFAHYWE